MQEIVHISAFVLCICFMQIKSGSKKVLFVVHSDSKSRFCIIGRRFALIKIPINKIIEVYHKQSLSTLNSINVDEGHHFYAASKFQFANILMTR